MDMSEKISQFLFDARKFTTNFKLHIEKMPLQIYASALPCAPKKSMSRNLFETEVPTWITQFPVVQSDWGAFSHNLGVTEEVTSLEFSSDNKLLLAGSSQKASLFETSTWRCVLGIDGGDYERGWLAQILLSPDGTRLVGFLDDGAARLWHVNDGRCTSLDRQGEEVVGMGFSKDGDEFVCLLKNRNVLIMNGQTGHLLAKLTHGVEAIPIIYPYVIYFNVAASKNCLLIAIVDKEENINVVDRSHGSVVYKYKHDLGSYGPIRPPTFSDDGRFLLSGSTNGHVIAWDSATKALYDIEAGKELAEATFLAGSMMVAIVFTGLTVSRWSFQTGGLGYQNIDYLCQNAILSEHCRVLFPQSGPIVTCMTSSGYSDIWKNIQTTCAQIKDKSHGGNKAISFSPNGKFIASSTHGHDVSIWEVSGRDIQGKSTESDDPIVW